MSVSRLSALDMSFLEVESQSAHMHVGWAALLEPPERGSAPGFDELADHIRVRLGRAPRYRQVLRSVPFGLGSPAWVDDPAFALSNHLVRCDAEHLADVVDACMSEPLPRDLPLWQLWIAPRLEGGKIGLVGKLHHCMVDGIAAVQLGSLLLDPAPDSPSPEPDEWRPAPAPGRLGLLASGVAEMLRRQLRIASTPARIAGSPGRALAAIDRGRRSLEALADSLRPARPQASLNPPISPRRHLVCVGRPVEDLLAIKRELGVKLNDVVLAVATSAVRSFLAGRGEQPVNVKAMVPVNLREDDEGDALGNRISFMFIDLPCEEPDPVRQLRELHVETDDRKRRGTPEGGGDVLGALAIAPGPLRRRLARMIASPRAFNLVVSNIPGPREPSWMLGCRLVEAFPVVPLADRHALSIGFTTIAERACFGLYADPEALPDADELGACLDRAIDRLAAGPAQEAAAQVPAFA